MGETGPDQDDTRAARYRRQTESQLLAGGFAILAVVGGALMWWFYGATTAGIGLALILLAVGLFALLWLILAALERWARS
jgi:fucose permease